MKRPGLLRLRRPRAMGPGFTHSGQTPQEWVNPAAVPRGNRERFPKPMVACPS
jgi:hypothetical protein